VNASTSSAVGSVTKAPVIAFNPRPRSTPSMVRLAVPATVAVVWRTPVTARTPGWPAMIRASAGLRPLVPLAAWT
jgi:hypothetical protein